MVPGRIGDSLSEGCNELIKLGAAIITSPKDILDIEAIRSKIDNKNGLWMKVPENSQNMQNQA